MRRSNTTRVWSSLPEMMCLSSASSASTALECSLRLFSRAGPAWQVTQAGEGVHQSPLETPRPSWGSQATTHPGETLKLLCPYPTADGLPGSLSAGSRTPRP